MLELALSLAVIIVFLMCRKLIKQWVEQKDAEVQEWAVECKIESQKNLQVLQKRINELKAENGGKLLSAEELLKSFKNN